MPRRSTRIINKYDQKAVTQKGNDTKHKEKPNLKTEAKKEIKKEVKKESKRISRSKVKTIRSIKKFNERDNKTTKSNPRSNHKAKNSKSQSKDLTDESSNEVISTNLDLNESNSDIKEIAKNKNVLKKNQKISEAPKNSNPSNSDLANLTKTFDNFIKFCQIRFDLLENKIVNNRRAANPNPIIRNRSDNKKMSLEDKIELRNKILNLNREQIMELYNMLKNNSKKSNQSELEIDLMKIPDKTLREIKQYVESCLIKEKEDFIKDFNKLATETEKKVNEIKATNSNKEVITEHKGVEVIIDLIII